MLKIKINGQFANKYNDKQIVSDAINFIQIEFIFDNSWDGLNKTYQFSNGSVTIDVETNDTIINIPSEVLITGELVVKVRGVKLNSDGNVVEVKATTNPLYYKITSSELTIADNSQPVAPEIKEQIRQLAERANMVAENTMGKVVEIENQIYVLLAIKDDVLQLKADTQVFANNANLSALNAKNSEDNIQDMIYNFTSDINNKINDFNSNIDSKISNFITEEENRVLAEQERVEAENLREISTANAIQNAGVATINAQNAADEANLARDNIQEQYNTVVNTLNDKIKSAVFTAPVNNITNVVHNLTFNPTKDDLVVSYRGILLDVNDNYKHNANYNSIDLVGWSINTGEKILFRLYKDVK